VHSADVGMEKVDGLEAFSANLGVEVDSAGGKTPHAEDAEHALGRQIKTCGKLVGIPAQERVTGVGVDGAECAGIDGDLELVHGLVASEGGVVGLEVQLEVGEEVVGPQEVEAGGRVEVVLVFGRFLGFRLDVEGTCEANLFLELDGHVQQPRQVIEL